MKNTDSFPIMSFETQQDWEKWLAEHHADTEGIWLKLAKKERRYILDGLVQQFVTVVVTIRGRFSGDLGAQAHLELNSLEK